MTAEGSSLEAAGAPRVVRATALNGSRGGSKLLIWSAGQCSGDLGWPRLNQRAALYAEQLFERRAALPLSSKRFEVPGEGEIEVRFELRSEEVE